MFRILMQFLKSPPIVWWCYAALLVVLLCFSTFHALDPKHLMFAEDQALSFAVGSKVAQGSLVLLGPPSHIGGRHLGPWMYYLVGGALRLSGGDVMTANKLFSALSVFGFLVAAAMSALGCVGRSRYVAVLAALASVTIGSYMDVSRVFWHSNLLFIPGLAVLGSGYLLLSFGWAFAALYFFVASLTLQLHFSSLPLLLAFPLLWCGRRQSTETLTNAWARALMAGRVKILCISLGLLSWVPLLYFEAIYGGNLAQVAAGMHGEHAHAGLREALLTIARFFVSFFAGGVGLGRGGIFIVLSVVLFSTALALLWFVYRESTSRLRQFSWAVMLSLFFYALLLSRQEAPLYDYYLYALLPLPVLLSGVITAQAVALLRRSAVGLVAKTIAALFLVSLSAAYVRFALDKKTLPYQQTLHRVFTLGFARDVALALKQDSERAPHMDGASILGFNALKTMRDPIYFFMGEEFFPLMHYGERFKELGFQERAVGRQAYFVSCPKMDQRSNRAVADSLRTEWDLGEVVDPSWCTSCRICLMRRMSRR